MARAKKKQDNTLIILAILVVVAAVIYLVFSGQRTDNQTYTTPGEEINELEQQLNETFEDTSAQDFMMLEEDASTLRQ